MKRTDLQHADVLVTDVDTPGGEAVALALAGAGARVWTVSGRAERLHAVVDRIVAEGGRVDFRVMDLSVVDEVEDLVVDIRAKAPRLRVVVDTGSTLTDEGLEVLIRGLDPVLSAEGGAVILLHGDVPAPRVSARLIEELGQRSVSVNALTTGSDDDVEARAAATYLARLTGEPTGRVFDLDHLSRALSTQGEEYVSAHFGELAEVLPLLSPSP